MQPVLAGKHDLLIADHAGSGKTLAYLAPLAQKLLEQERGLLPSGPPNIPRVLVVVPTEELCAQVHACVHCCKKRWQSVKGSIRLMLE